MGILSLTLMFVITTTKSRFLTVSSVQRFILAFILIFPWDVITQDIVSISEEKRKAIIWESESYLGLKYRTKVKNATFDCSGFVNYVLKKADILVSRSSTSLIRDGVRVKNIQMARPGDIIVFKGRNVQAKTPGHVGLVHHWENDTLYFVHSSVTKGVTIDHIHDPYYSRRFMQVRDVIGD